MLLIKCRIIRAKDGIFRVLQRRQSEVIALNVLISLNNVLKSISGRSLVKGCALELNIAMAV